jgi:hypothetical protein
VACPGLADAIHAGDEARIGAAVTAAAARTPPGTGAVVLGCTEYELVADRIRVAVPGAVPFGSAEAVAAQALRRAAGGRPPDRAANSDCAGASEGSTHGTLDGSADGGSRGDAVRAPGCGIDVDTTPEAGVSRAARVGRRGAVHVLLSGRPGQLPAAALRYREGRLLATAAGGASVTVRRGR